MPFYRLYHIEHSRLVGADGIDASDDAEATLAAKRLNGTAAAELWQGSRKVATLRADAIGRPRSAG